MTAVQGDGGGVTEAEVAMARAIFMLPADEPVSRPSILAARRALAHFAARPAPAGDAEGVARLRAEVEGARRWCALVQAQLELNGSTIRESQAALTVAREGQAAAETALAEARAELVLLDEVCGHYALDEARFLRDDGEPFGSVPIEAGMKAREAGRRYVEREMAEQAATRAEADAVLADSSASDDDKHEARFTLKCLGFAAERLAPLLAHPGTADPGPAPAADTGGGNA